MIQSTNKNKEKHNNHILIEMKNYLDRIRSTLALVEIIFNTCILTVNILTLEYTGSEESNKRNEHNQL